MRDGERLPPVDEAALRAAATQAGRAAILLDFDGTLSAIVDDPERARPVPGAVEALTALGARFALVAVISGRPVSVLRARLGTPPGVRLVGLYGVEQLVDGALQVDREAARQRGAVADAADALERALAGLEGVTVERKGLSVAAHFRRAPDPARAQADGDPIVREVAARTGLGAIRAGRLVLEIGPAVGVDKGSAARALLGSAPIRVAVAAGDDAGDVALFEAATTVEHALRIAVLSDESPAELIDAADAGVDGPEELVRVLSVLAHAAGP